MTIKYLHHTIEKVTHPDTGKTTFNLSHWMYSTEMPHIAMRWGIGYYNSIDEAEIAHARQVIFDNFGDKE